MTGVPDLAAAILVLNPAATFDSDQGNPACVWIVDRHDGNGQQISNWPTALGTEPTAAQLAAVTQQQVAQQQQQAQRAPAITILSAIDPTGNACLLCSLLVSLVQQLNVLRDRCTAQDNAVAAATSLANLQSRWASLAAAAPLPDITKAQVISAITNAINAGSGDTTTS